MSIPLVGSEDVRIGRGGGKTKGERYGKYRTALKPHLKWIEESIDASKDGSIRMKTKDFAKSLGKEFESKNETSIYWGTLYSLFDQGIFVGTGTHQNGDKVLVMRRAVEGDKLPASLQKYRDSYTSDEDNTSEEEDVDNPPEDEDEDDK